MTSANSFEDYLASLSPFVHQGAGAEPEAVALCQRATATLANLSPLDSTKLASAVAADPHMAPVLAAAMGLSQERFKTWLQGRFQTAGWVVLGRNKASALVEALDEDFDLVDLLQAQLDREWTWADVLARIMAPRQRAGGSIQQGRELEDEVEKKIVELGLEFVPRTRFVGRASRTAPADFAIPSGEDALIAIAVKVFSSTGSKLTDAIREINEMVEVKLPRQYVFAVVDGQGWVRRRNDLRGIHQLWVDKLIDGLYPRGQLDALAEDLKDAAVRVGLLDR